MTPENTSPAFARLNFMRMVSAIVEYPKPEEQRKAADVQSHIPNNNKPHLNLKAS